MAKLLCVLVWVAGYAGEGMYRRVCNECHLFQQQQQQQQQREEAQQAVEMKTATAVSFKKKKWDLTVPRMAQ